MSDAIGDQVEIIPDPKCPHGYGAGDHHFESGHCHDYPTSLRASRTREVVKVWVVTVEDYSGANAVEGVFTTEALAMDYIAKPCIPEAGDVYYSVVEVVIDELVEVKS